MISGEEINRLKRSTEDLFRSSLESINDPPKFKVSIGSDVLNPIHVVIDQPLYTIICDTNGVDYHIDYPSKSMTAAVSPIKTWISELNCRSVPVEISGIISLWRFIDAIAKRGYEVVSACGDEEDIMGELADHGASVASSGLFIFLPVGRFYVEPTSMELVVDMLGPNDIGVSRLDLRLPVAEMVAQFMEFAVQITKARISALEAFCENERPSGTPVVVDGRKLS